MKTAIHSRISTERQTRAAIAAYPREAVADTAEARGGWAELSKTVRVT